MSDVLQIITKREGGKVFIEMNSDSLAAHTALLEVIVGEVHERLWEMPEGVVPPEEGKLFDDVCNFFDNMQDSLRSYDSWMSNIPTEVDLDWYDKQPDPEPVLATGATGTNGIGPATSEAPPESN